MLAPFSEVISKSKDFTNAISSITIVEDTLLILLYHFISIL